MEAMVKRWGDTYGVGPRLREFFSSEDGKNLIEAFLAEAGRGESRPDLEVLPFILIHYVWPESEWEKHPQLNQRKAAVKLLRQMARKLQLLSGSGKLLPLDEMRSVEIQLRNLATQLEQPQKVQVGHLQIFGEPASSKRHRAKRRVVFFLTGYFRAIGCSRPPWALITKVLRATKLVDPHTTAKSVGTWWSTILERELTPGEPLEPAQESHVQLFHEGKKRVHEMN